MAKAEYTLEEARKLGLFKQQRTGARRSKYGNIRVEIDGILLDSLREAGRYRELRSLNEVDLIWDFKVHPRYLVAGPGKNGEPAIYYEADFVYKSADMKEGIIAIAEDVKGYETPLFKLKKLLMQEKWPQIDLQILKE